MAATLKTIEEAVQTLKEGGELRPITDVEVMKFKLDRQELKDAERLARRLRPDVDAMNTDLIARFRAGAPLLTEAYTVAVDESFQRTEEIDYKAIAHNYWRSHLGITDIEAHERKLKSEQPKNTYPKFVVSEKPSTKPSKAPKTRKKA